MSSSVSNDKINGVNTQMLSTVFDSIKNRPEMAKTTFSVETQWKGGFSVTSSCKSPAIDTLTNGTSEILGQFII